MDPLMLVDSHQHMNPNFKNFQIKAGGNMYISCIDKNSLNKSTQNTQNPQNF